MTALNSQPRLDIDAVNDQRGAVISADGRYRYRLWRIWDDLGPVMVWIMLNPSTADADTDDATIKKCTEFAKRNRHGGILVVNLFAWRATDPRELRHVNDPIGPDNDGHVAWACNAPLLATVVAGWGTDTFAAKRAASVRVNLAGQSNRLLHCFRQNAKGRPWHPLYLPYAASLQPLGRQS